jgi:CHAT domain-containing protein/tetratricopeptide (TPR) repeat protein
VLLYAAAGPEPSVTRARSQGGTTQASGDNFDGGALPTTVEARRRALAEATAAAARLRQSGEAAPLSRSLRHASELHLKLNDPDAAATAAEESLAAARRAGDGPLLVDALTSSAVARRSRADNKSALRLLNEAQSLSLSLGYRRGEARSLEELSVSYFQQAELEKAVSSGQRAAQLWRDLQDRAGEARALYYLGAPYMRLGDVRRSAATLESALSIWRELDNAVEQASTLVELNFLAIRLGQWQRALGLLNEARSLLQDKEAEPFIAGQIANSLGEVYEAYGQLETALTYFEEALTLYRDHARDREAAATARRKAGRVRARLGDYALATQQIEDSLREALEIDDKRLAALCHEDLGRVYLTAGQHDAAAQQFSQAVALHEQGGRRREWARAQTFLGQTRHLLGDAAAAAESYRQALQVFRSFEDYTNEAALCFGLGKLELEQQNLDAAGDYLKRSIELTEQLRENAPSKDLRSSFLDSVHDRYETYVELLMQRHAAQPGEGFNVAAFEASELGRARSLVDSIRDHRRELRRAADPALLLEEERLQVDEQKLLDRRARLRSEEAPEESRQEVEAELVRLRSRRETLEAQINSSASFNALLRPAPLKLADIQNQVLDAETSLLEYSLGGQKSYLWIITPAGLESYELADKRVIEAAAHKLAVLLNEPPDGAQKQEETRAAVAELSRLVLGPVADKLKTYRLIVVPDGILQYIPFQILTPSQDSDEPLIARHEIINAPSASTLALVRQQMQNRPAAPKLLAALGDPVLSSNYSWKAPGARAGRGGGPSPLEEEQRRQRRSARRPEQTPEPSKLPPLFFAKDELNELRRMAPTDEALIYTEFDATRDNLRNLDLTQYRILHVATHGLLNAREPELSGLVMSLVDQEGRPLNGFVGLADIYKLHAPVDLVVLSACQTALGKEVRGEGLVGLTRGFLYAGASSVVASLWEVDDEVTAELMKRFYDNMLRRGMRPAAALREAQNSIRQEPQWRSPYYWAAFTLQGEYRQIIKPAPAGAATTAVAAGAAVALLAGGSYIYLRRRRRCARSGYSTTKK